MSAEEHECQRCLRPATISERGVEHECKCVRCGDPLTPGPSRYCDTCSPKIPSACLGCKTIPCVCHNPED